MAPASHVRDTLALLGDDERPLVDVVPGGAERSESVARGLARLHPDDDVVLVHDAARCLAPAALFERVAAALAGGDEAVVPGLPVTDTVKAVDAEGYVTSTPDRAGLRAVQTPQGFSVPLLRRAHAGGAGATDDAGLVERLGVAVRVVPGDPLAVKVTTAADLEHAERLVAAGGLRLG